jgi:hypothetical protein
LDCDGIVSIETYHGDAKNIPVTNMTRVNYISPLPGKIYYSPQYESQAALTRIPDFRTQLFWSPTLDLDPGAMKTLSFFTGDLPGKYVIEVVGLTSRGDRIYETKTFEVK